MTSNRRAKIRILSRVNRRNTVIRSVLNDLSDILGREIVADAVASAEDSDSLLETFKEGYRAAKEVSSISYRRFFTFDRRRQVFQLATCLAERFNEGEKATFLTKLGDDIGGIKVEISPLLKQTERVLEFDRDSITVLSNDKKQGILIDYNRDDPTQTYEITVWGDQWPVQVLACEHAD